MSRSGWNAPMQPFAWTNWSWLVWSRGIPVRLHWTLLLIAVIAGIEMAHRGYWWLIPAAMLIAPIVLVVHVAVAHGVGVRHQSTVLWALNDASEHDGLALRPGVQAAVAAAGPVVSLLLALVAWLAIDDTPAVARPLTSLLALTSLYVGLWNLLPCWGMDGARLWRAALWPLTGLGRACRWTNTAGVVAGIGLAIWGLAFMDVMMAVFGMMLTAAGWMERLQQAEGWDMTLGAALPPPPRRSWWQRWQDRRQEIAVEREAEAAHQDQLDLDRLLAKVSSEGLAALSDRERTRLRQISARQRERDGQ